MCSLKLSEGQRNEVVELLIEALRKGGYKSSRQRKRRGKELGDQPL